MKISNVTLGRREALTLLVIATLVISGSVLHEAVRVNGPRGSATQVVGFQRAGTVIITGVVMDQNTMSPIDGALVSVQAGTAFTTTSADGTYSLEIPDTQGSTLVAARHGYYNSATIYTGATSASFALEPTPTADNPSYQFLPPSNCAVCHQEQVQQWTGSPMAKAGTNAWVHDIYSGTGTPNGDGGFVYLRDSQFAESNPESECAACHQPERWIETPVSAMQGPTDAGYPSDAVVHGISCETCHKVADVDVSMINFPGIFEPAVRYVRPPAGRQLMFGLLGDTSFHINGVMEAAYNPQLSAEVCGTCHQDKNDINLDHTFTGVTSEPTYVEWADSPYSDPEADEFATCISCHMPATGASSACLVSNPGRGPYDVRSHDIRGTTPDFLENAAELELETAVQAGELRVDVDVINAYTGHHLPTGVTIRNMILLVEATRASDGQPLTHTGDETVHELGGVGDPNEGYYAGLPGRFFAKVNMDADGNGPTFFTDAVAIEFDNRIPALQTDSSTYTFALPKNPEDIDVRASLIYRRAFRFLVDAKQWTEDGHGTPLADVAPPHYGHLMEIEETTISLTDCPGDCNGDGTVAFSDLIAILGVFGDTTSGPCDADGSGAVNFSDLIAAITLFGPCE